MTVYCEGLSSYVCKRPQKLNVHPEASEGLDCSAFVETRFIRLQT
jgi:hypothetical protein